MKAKNQKVAFLTIFKYIREFLFALLKFSMAEFCIIGVCIAYSIFWTAQAFLLLSIYTLYNIYNI